MTYEKVYFAEFLYVICRISDGGKTREIKYTLRNTNCGNCTSSGPHQCQV